MEININASLIDTLNKVANDDGVTPEVYIESKMNAYLFSAYKGMLSKMLEEQTIDNVKTIVEAVATTIEGIKAKEIEEQKVIESTVQIEDTTDAKVSG